MTPEEAWQLLETQSVAVLATINRDGTPHLVPFTFAPLAGRRLITAVDAKPKGSRRLRRLDNISRDERVTVLADHYEEDWSKLWWVRAQGSAEVLADPPAVDRAALIERYPDYLHHDLGPWIVIDVRHITGWSANT